MGKDEKKLMIALFLIGAILVGSGLAISSTILKWIMLILGIGSLGLCAACILDIEIRKRKKETAKKNKVAERKKEFDNFSDEERTSIHLHSLRRPKDDDYGYSITNPIITSSYVNTREYIEKLRGIDGSHYTWELIKRIDAEIDEATITMDGIPFHFEKETICVNEYQCFLSGEPYKKMYFCPQGRGRIRYYVPKGMILGGSGVHGYSKECLNEEQRTNTYTQYDKEIVEKASIEEIPIENLRKLKKLHDSEIITDAEFSDKKKQLLGI